MQDFSVVYMPTHIHDRTKYSKGHGGNHGSPGEHHKGKYDPISGEYLQGINGCKKFQNCFKCPFPRCKSELNKRAK